MKSPFQPTRLGPHLLKNALAVAPMTTTQSLPSGAPSEAELRWLERLADDGYGLVLSCAAAISRTAIAFPRQLSFGDDSFLPALTELVRRVARPGMALVAQLCHGGSRALPELTGQAPHSASRFELPIPNFIPPVELSTPQIEAIVEDFATAAQRAARAGFHGVEFHGANGYLFTQFASTSTNLRRDAWGGGLPQRARFAREVLRATRARVPKDFLLGMRWSFESPFDPGLDLDEGLQVMAWLAEDGLDYVHASALNLQAPSSKYPQDKAFRRIRTGLDPALPLVGAGGVTSRESLEEAMALGADVVAIGRAAIGNARLPAKLEARETLNQTPFSRGQLKDLAVSEDFVQYLSTAVPLAPLKIVQAS